MNVEVKITGSLARQLKKRVNQYHFEVGILKDGPYYEPESNADGLIDRQLGSFAGGPIRKKTRQWRGQMISDVAKANMDRLGFNFFARPFKDESQEIVKFTKAYLLFLFRNSSLKRVENLLQAVVRNPILRGDYGTNSEFTEANKGFNRYMIDTGQMFRAIRARAVKK